MMRYMYIALAANLALNLLLLVLILLDVPGALNASRFSQALVIHLILIMGYVLVYRRLKTYMGDAAERNETSRSTIWFFAFVAQYLVCQSLH